MSQTSKSRKAVSPVVATLLLILIAISASIIIYAWVTGLSSAGKSTTIQTNERISIEAAKISIDTQANTLDIDVYVRNVGEVAVNLTDIKIYVYNMRDGTLIGQIPLQGNGITVDYDPQNGVITPGEVGKITVSNVPNAGDGLKLRSGEYYRVEVTLPSGFKDSIVVRAQ